MQDALILCRFVHFGAVLLLFGIGAFRGLLFGNALSTFESGARRVRLDRALLWTSAVALISAVAWLLLVTADMAGNWHDAVDRQTLSAVLGSTFFGRVWSLHLLLALLVLLLSLRGAQHAPRRLLLLNALLLMTLAPVGHGAMFDGLTGWLLIANQAAHLLGVASWLGGLCMLAVLLRGAGGVDLHTVLLRFSGIGYGLVALIVATGLINIRALTGALWPAPAFAGFGLVLSLKLMLVLCMLALAAFNRHLARAGLLNLPALRKSVMLESLFGAAALATVSLLGTLPPIPM
ncbi:copper homeostasis membrane protein CopD [Pseudomonas sp. NPDC090202]|uniref:copper homeostasis membrane protein CopD n=1 Tax=unclassified Pseudomonas TaxID=196821 RepID=UPI0038058491